MILCETIQSLNYELNKIRAKGLSVGFVPTMGALHQGHLSLLENCNSQNDISVVSIFVNPTQFNNPKDLEKYPRNLQADLDLISSKGCDVVFAPSVAEIYDNESKATSINLGPLGETMEGKFRPGHFAGVMQIVEILFRLVQPQKAYFGRKDFQQVAVIKFMTHFLELPIEIVVGETIREKNGLALSSRNQLLTPEQRKEATIIFKTLSEGKDLAKKHSPLEVSAVLADAISKSSLQLEYLQIVDPITLESLENSWVAGATACIVAYCNGVRLLDNHELVPQ